VRGVDLRAFVRDLPGAAEVAAFDTDDASGSTSLAASIVEAFEAGAHSLLLDEERAATNLLVRDARMQGLVERGDGGAAGRPRGPVRLRRPPRAGPPPVARSWRRRSTESAGCACADAQSSKRSTSSWRRRARLPRSVLERCVFAAPSAVDRAASATPLMLLAISVEPRAASVRLRPIS
jgi:hypothetical protein